MRRFWTRLRSFGHAALRGLRASPLTSAVAVVTIAVALVPVGGLMLVTGNMGALLAEFGHELQVTAYLDPALPVERAREVAARAAAVPGVDHVEFVTREAALERFRARLGGAGLLEALDENPLPPSLEIALTEDHRSPEGVRRVVTALDGLPGVDELIGRESWMEGYARALVLVRSSGIGLGGVLGFATLLIVANTIRLAVYARRDELEILSLVGASRTFIAVPFLLEGLIQGICGGLLGLALLYAIFMAAVPQLADALELFLGWADPDFLPPSRMVLLVGGGAAFGLLGAGAAVAGAKPT